VTPRSSREAFGPGTPEYFAARLKAPPVEGVANEALIALVARTFGLSRRAVVLVAGDTARLKRLHLIGDPEALAKIAAALYDEAL
jgi:uncharacterized protein YggU (UPF0235/DUF167 family)